MLYGRARGCLPYSPAEGLSWCGAELAQGLSYLSRHRQQLCGRGLGVCRTFVPLRCRSASSWTAKGRLGEPCSYRQLREGTGSERCHIPFWGTYEPCRFSTREVRMDVYDWQGYINRLQNSSFFSTTIFVPARSERSLLRLSREQPKMRLAKKSNLCADP